MAYWDPGWKDIVIYGEHVDRHPEREYASVLDEVIRDGFDGIYLDWLEGYEDEDVVAAAGAAGLDSAVEMIALVEEIKQYGTRRSPGFLVIQQNAAALVDRHPALVNLIDGIAQEGIWYDGDATDDWNEPDGHDREVDQDLTQYYLGYLGEYLDAGLPVLDCEYALEHAGSAYRRSYAAGLVPYVTRTSLSRLTTTPPPGY